MPSNKKFLDTVQKEILTQTDQYEKFLKMANNQRMISTSKMPKRLNYKKRAQTSHGRNKRKLKMFNPAKLMNIELPGQVSSQRSRNQDRYRSKYDIKSQRLCQQDQRSEKKTRIKSSLASSKHGKQLSRLKKRDQDRRSYMPQSISKIQEIKKMKSLH